jgi:hypothetical protein
MVRPTRTEATMDMTLILVMMPKRTRGWRTIGIDAIMTLGEESGGGRRREGR